MCSGLRGHPFKDRRIRGNTSLSVRLVLEQAPPLSSISFIHSNANWFVSRRPVSYPSLLPLLYVPPLEPLSHRIILTLWMFRSPIRDECVVMKALRGPFYQYLLFNLTWSTIQWYICLLRLIWCERQGKLLQTFWDLISLLQLGFEPATWLLLLLLFRHSARAKMLKKSAWLLHPK